MVIDEAGVEKAFIENVKSLLSRLQRELLEKNKYIKNGPSGYLKVSFENKVSQN